MKGLVTLEVINTIVAAAEAPPPTLQDTSVLSDTHDGEADCIYRVCERKDRSGR